MDTVRSGNGAGRPGARLSPGVAETLPLPVERLHDYLEQLLAHPAWSGSPRRSALLRHLVAETLAGRGARLKGAVIAMELFGDRAGANLQADASVRVEAGRLRSDLDSHYVGAGRDDPVRISIPKGGYRAVFDLAGARSARVPADRPQPCEARPHAGAGASDLPRVLVRPFAALGGEPRLREAYAETRAGLERAVLCDPGYADAWANLAFLRLDGRRFGHDPEAERGDFGPALEAARRALALDPDTIPGHLALLLVQHYAGEAAGARATAEQALQISPHDADALASMGWLRVIWHNDPAGLADLERAVARSVNPPPRPFRSIAVHRMMWGDPEPFLEAARRAAADGYENSQALLAIACARTGRQDEAAAALAAMARRSPALAADPVAYMTPHRTHPAIIAAIEAGLRAAGWSPPQAG